MLSWLRAQVVVVAFVVVGAIMGPVIALETPPFAVPDEHLHFYESCAISMGHVLPGHDAPPHRLTMRLPMGLVDFGRDFLTHKGKAFSLPQIAVADAHRLRANDVRRFLVLEETRDWGYYPPVQYAPQAIGCGVARALDLRPALVFVFVRLANLLAYLVVGALALRTLQFAREAMLLLLLAPMSLAMAASASGDGPLLSFLALWLALVTRTDVAPLLRPRHIAGYAVFAFCLAMSKVVYAPLMASFLLVPAERFSSTRVRIGAIAIVGISAVIGALAWLPETGDALTAFATSPKHNPLQVIETAFLAPHATLRMWGNTLVSTRIITGFAGNLGLRDVPLPMWCYWIFYPALLATMAGGGAVASTSRIRKGGAWLSALALLSMLALFTFYMAWVDMTAVDERVRSLQGRHLLPIAFALAVGVSMVCTTTRLATRARAIALPLVAIAASVTLIAQVPSLLRARYYAPHDAVAAALLPFRTPPPITSVDRMDPDP